MGAQGKQGVCRVIIWFRASAAGLGEGGGGQERSGGVMQRRLAEISTETKITLRSRPRTKKLVFKAAMKINAAKQENRSSDAQ